MRSRPNSSGQGLSNSTQAVAEPVLLAADRIELTTVPLELLALRLHDLRRRPLDEPFVGEHPLAARDLLLETLDFCLRVAVGLHPLRPDDRLENSELVALESRPHAASPEDLGGGLHALE